MEELPMSKTQKRKSVSYAKYGYLFSLPFVVAYVIFHLYPTIYTAIIGFTEVSSFAISAA